MKTAGILLLFGLCTAIGLRLAAKKSEGVDSLHALERDLSAFSAAFDGGEGSLLRIAQRGQGVFFVQLRAYLDALQDGFAEGEAARLAAQAFAPTPLHAATLLFFGGLSLCSREELKARTEQFRTALKEAIRDAAPQIKQAKLLRAVGVLCGAALAVLLI